MAHPFEEKLNSLDSIVQALEKGDLSLEEALAHFEEGVKLVKQCQKTLSQAELRVHKVMEKEGKIVAVPFKTNEEP